MTYVYDADGDRIETCDLLDNVVHNFWGSEIVASVEYC